MFYSLETRMEWLKNYSLKFVNFAVKFICYIADYFKLSRIQAIHIVEKLKKVFFYNIVYYLIHLYLYTPSNKHGINRRFHLILLNPETDPPVTNLIWTL